MPAESIADRPEVFACELAGFVLSEADGFVFIRFFVRAKYRQSGRIHLYSQYVRRATRIFTVLMSDASGWFPFSDLAEQRLANGLAAAVRLKPRYCSFIGLPQGIRSNILANVRSQRGNRLFLRFIIAAYQFNILVRISVANAKFRNH